MNKQIDIEVESLSGRRSLILGLAWPALTESMLSSLVSVVDMIMVGSMGAYALGAVGLVTQPRFLMLAAFMALNVGSTAMVSRFKGSGSRDNANLVLHHYIVMALGVSIILCLIMFFGGDSLIYFIAGNNISGDMVAGAHIYLRVQVYGFPMLALTYTINAVLRGVGNTRAAFYNNAVANIVNVFFNYCLIYGNLGFPKWGLMGAAMSTNIAQCAALAMALSKVLSGKEFVRLSFNKLFHLDLLMIKRMMKIGLPALVEQVIMRTGMMLYTIIVTSLGDHSYAAHMIAMNLQQISFMTGMSFGAAATTLVGQCLGRSRADLAKLYVKMTQNISYIVAIGVSIVLFFGGEFISSLYTRDPGLARLSGDMLKIIAVVNPLSCARLVYTSALRGAGDSRYVAVITFVGVILIRPLLSVFLVFPPFPFQLGLAGIWIALSSDGVVCFLLAMSRFNKGKWTSIKV